MGFMHQKGHNPCWDFPNERQNYGKKFNLQKLCNIFLPSIPFFLLECPLIPVFNAYLLTRWTDAHSSNSGMPLIGADYLRLPMNRSR